jgi:saccharopine dehydrogenase-like NADP-dependent oxidoreductase
MNNVLVLGAGRVGKSVAELLLACGHGAYSVTLADRDEANLREARENLSRLKDSLGRAVEFKTLSLDASNPAAVRAALAGHQYVICMLPFNCVAGVADAANDAGVHYFDVTEDVRATDRVRAIEASGKAKIALVPQCGLAPGYIAIAANHIARRFEKIHSLTLRVGALPQYPTNALKYNVTWSAAGVVNEYCEPCNVMLGGERVKVPALEGLENFSFEGVEYEAFYTSGGVGTLVETLVDAGKTGPNTTVAYKTIRYPGHRDLMKFLLQDLRLECDDDPAFNRATAVRLLEHGVPRTLQDVIVVFINCIGTFPGSPIPQQINFQRSIRAVDLLGRTWPGIELTTSAGVCAMVDLHRQGKLPTTGLIKQEQCDLELFNATVFGMAYENPAGLDAAVRAVG